MNRRCTLHPHEKHSVDRWWSESAGAGAAETEGDQAGGIGLGVGGGEASVNKRKSRVAVFAALHRYRWRDAMPCFTPQGAQAQAAFSV
jgi:hypothetical protein